MTSSRTSSPFDMPSFTSQIPNLQAVGPVVELRVAVGSAVEAALKRTQSPVPAPVTVVAMIDTGATKSVIRQGLASQLGLQPIGVVAISTPSSANFPCNEYSVRFLFPNNVGAEGTAIEAPLHGQHIQCLIGRDILAHAVLLYIGYTNLFSLSF